MVFEITSVGACSDKLGRVLLIATACAILSVNAAAKATYVKFVVPGATSTSVFPINASGMVGGSWTDETGYTHGFVRTPDGVISKIDVPDAYSTEVYSINDKGVTIGSSDMDGTRQSITGFIRQPNGKFSTFDAPGSDGITWIRDINEHNAIVGSYGGSGAYHGFIRQANGKFISFDVPGAADTFGSAINDEGTVAGYWDEPPYFLDHGFIRTANGKITTFDIDGARTVWVRGINNNGVVAGFYDDADSVNHGYVRGADGTVTTFNFPGEKGGTTVGGINAAGEISGYSIHQTAFIRSPNGKFRTFRLKNQPTSGGSINDKGWVGGSYGDGRGFIRMP